MHYDHIDRPPMGDIAGIIVVMIAGNPNIDFIYRYDIDGDAITIDTRQIKDALGKIPINHPDVIRWLMQRIVEGSMVK